MKRILFILLIGVVTMIGCTKDTGQLNDNFALSSGAVQFDGNTITCNPERHKVIIEVANESANGQWKASSPSIDIWCSFEIQGGRLILTIAENETDFPRSSRIEISLDGDTRRIEVHQNYIRRLAFAAGTTTTVGASNANIAIPLLTNIPVERLNITEPPNCDWIISTVLSADKLSFTVLENPSVSTPRQATFQLEGDGLTTSITVIQNAMNGYSYVINLSEADFSDCYIYEIWDDVNHIKIGELCKEYLHKNKNGTQSVRMQAVVAYPMAEDKVDLSNGLVVENGYFLCWTSTNILSEILAYYTKGETFTGGTPTVIYLDKGAARMTTYQISAPPAERINAVLRPYLLRDQRSGEVNNAGQDTENFTYKVVKIGTQYWMAENLRTSRFRDGTNIPTNISSTVWGENPGMPLCLIAAQSNNSINANNTTAIYINGRMEYGLLYTYYAIINRDGQSKEQALTEPFEDMISPPGWKIPSQAELKFMRNYVTQSTNEVGNWPELDANGTGLYGNASGFGIKINRYRLPTTTGFSALTLLASMDYLHDPSQVEDYDAHRFYCFRMLENSEFTVFQGNNFFSCRAAVHIRCLRVDNE